MTEKHNTMRGLLGAIRKLEQAKPKRSLNEKKGEQESVKFELVNLLSVICRKELSSGNHFKIVPVQEMNDETPDIFGPRMGFPVLSEEMSVLLSENQPLINRLVRLDNHSRQFDALMRH